VDCKEIQQQLERYFDGELPLSDKRALAEHLERCGECSGLLNGLKTIHVALNKQAVFPVPAGLKRRVRKQLRDDTAEDDRLGVVLPWMGFSGGVAALVSLITWGMLSFVAPPADSTVLDEIVSAHVRSLIVDHVTDIASSDQHTVKPWFKGKVDFAVPVTDLAGHGFPLLGGRMDYLRHRPVAAVVYRRRAHVVNVFVWPSDDGGYRAIEAESRRGYGVLHWIDAGLQYWMISDLNEKELGQLAGLLRGDASELRRRSLPNG